MKHYVKVAIILSISAVVQMTNAQTFNVWRGGNEREDWNDKYKWKLMHTPTAEEAVHFREPNSEISINSTVQLNNGMQLYGQELNLFGNGNLNFWSPIPHQRTVAIPASASGFANLTLYDNLSLNGRIALAAKAFGTSASKGSVTLKNRSTVTGELQIGNAGQGTGQVYVRNNSTYRITGLEIATKADSGGSAELHIDGGTVHIETKENPFEIFLEDASRRIVMGSMSTLGVESDLPLEDKKEQIKQMIAQNRLIAAPGSCLQTPTITGRMLTITAGDLQGQDPATSLENLLTSIDEISATAAMAKSDAQSITNKVMAKNKEDTSEKQFRLVGYIVFCGSCLLAFRRTEEEENA